MVKIPRGQPSKTPWLEKGRSGGAGFDDPHGAAERRSICGLDESVLATIRTDHQMYKLSHHRLLLRNRETVCHNLQRSFNAAPSADRRMNGASHQTL